MFKSMCCLIPLPRLRRHGSSDFYQEQNILQYVSKEDTNKMICNPFLCSPRQTIKYGKLVRGIFSPEKDKPRLWWGKNSRKNLQGITTSQPNKNTEENIELHGGNLNRFVIPWKSITTRNYPELPKVSAKNSIIFSFHQSLLVGQAWGGERRIEVERVYQRNSEPYFPEHWLPQGRMITGKTRRMAELSQED